MNSLTKKGVFDKKNVEYQTITYLSFGAAINRLGSLINIHDQKIILRNRERIMVCYESQHNPMYHAHPGVVLGTN